MKQELRGFYLLEMVVHGTVLPYALAYAVDAPITQVLQNLCVTGLGTVLDGCGRPNLMELAQRRLEGGEAVN